MKRTFLVAWREFTSVVLTRGFLLGVLMVPVIAAISIGAIFLMRNQQAPRAVGEVAIVDRTGLLADAIRKQFSAEGQKAEGAETTAKINQQLDKLPLDDAQKAQIKNQTAAQVESASDKSDLNVTIIQPGDLEATKEQIKNAKIKVSDTEGEARPVIALADLVPGLITPNEAGVYEGFKLFTAPKLSFEVQRRIENNISRAIVDVRIATDARVKASGMDAGALKAMLASPRAETITVSTAGETKSIGPLRMLIPMAFMALMLISVMTSGQYLMTTVVEEKSSRVMEVLLSAVSPMQLMVGKILGHMAVGLSILLVYGSLGVVGLLISAMMDLVSPLTLVLLVVYFLIAFFTIASLMAAIGSAVNEMREAQTLLTPVMMLIMLPWLLWMPIQRAPNSMFSTVLSFVPGVNPFVMVIRLGGEESIPTWQIPASIGVGLLAVVFSAWAAAKVFRIGVLMYGKPPNFKTLVKWVRMA